MKREVMLIKAKELFIVQLRYSEAKKSIGRYAARYAGRYAGRYAARYAGRNAGRYGEDHKEAQVMMRS